MFEMTENEFNECEQAERIKHDEKVKELEAQNKNLQEMLQATRETRVNADYHELCKLKDMRIAELEDKLANADYQLEGRDIKIKELEAQIEKMKCCGNCENGELSAHEEPCLHCQRCFASTDVTDQENVKDYWEAIKEIKEK